MKARAAVVRAGGGTLEELFQNAALALSACMVDASAVQPGGLRDKVRVEAAGWDRLLAAWLDAVVQQFTVNRIVIAAVPGMVLRGSTQGPCSLEAWVDGELWDPVRHGRLCEPKGCAPGGAHVVSEAGGWRAEAALDLLG